MIAASGMVVDVTVAVLSATPRGAIGSVTVPTGMGTFADDAIS
jgi:hypothetical protein